MNLDAVPPDRGPGIRNFVITIPFRILDYEVKGMPLPIWSPSVAVRYAIHAEGRDPMSPYLPIVRILNVFSLRRLDLNFITVLHVNPAI